MSTSKKNILVQLTHPALHKSKHNRSLLQAINGLDNINIKHLYNRYPDFHIDVKAEQQLLIQHDILVLQFPFYWYSSPSLLKEWIDLVLQHNWAYGKNGNMLKGKQLLVCITTGGGEQAYSPGGYNKYTIEDFLLPFKRTAILCKMKWLPPYVVHGTHMLQPKDLYAYADKYKKLLLSLRDTIFSDEEISKISYLNDLISD